MLQISPSVLRACFAHAHACMPRESCGVLAARVAEPLRVVAFFPMENQLETLGAPEKTGRRASEGYLIGPLEYAALEKRLAAQGHQAVAIMHSHVGVGAYFSAEDQRCALWEGRPLHPGLAFLVCGVGLEGEEQGCVLASYDPRTRDFRTVALQASRP